MSSTYSTNLALELIGTGDQSGTWGTTTNTNLGTLIEQAISGYVTQAITDGADTTITIPNGATGVARNMCIEMTGTLTAARNLIVPANKKLYFIYNNTTGGYAVTVKASGQTGVSVPNGKKMILVSNGTDVVVAENYLASLTLGAALPVASGGTGATSLTSNNVVLGNGTSAVQFVAPGTSGNVLTSNGTTWTSAAPASSGVSSFSAGSTGLTPSTGTTGNITLAGTLGVANGGTGKTSVTAYAVLCGGTTTTGAFQSIAGVGTSGQVLTSNGAGALPTFQAAGGVTSAVAGNGITVSGATGAVTISQDIYTGSTASNTAYPIGSYVVVNTSATYANNSSQDVRNAGGNTGFAIGSGTALTGTWRARGSFYQNFGLIGCTNVVVGYALFQRTA